MGLLSCCSSSANVITKSQKQKHEKPGRNSQRGPSHGARGGPWRQTPSHLTPACSVASGSDPSRSVGEVLFIRNKAAVSRSREQWLAGSASRGAWRAGALDNEGSSFLKPFVSLPSGVRTQWTCVLRENPTSEEPACASGAFRDT